MTTTRERITQTERGTWICRCGNRDDRQGFFPCDTGGRLVEPTEAEWPTPWYRCDQCGRIIDGRTGEVVGRRVEAWIPAPLDRETAEDF